MAIAFTTFNGEPAPARGTLPYGGGGVAVGQYAEIERVFTEEDLLKFGRLTGDL
jgi:hypothetical protein